MAKPLHSAQQPRDMQFSHFGVLNTGSQSKGSVATATVIMVVAAICCVILSAAAVKTAAERNRLAELTFVAVKPIEPLPKPIPKMIPPKPVPTPRVPTPVEPKIVLPKVEPPVQPKPIPMAQPKPLPVVTPAAPKVVTAAAAPKPMPVHLGASASVVNNSPHPSAVALGSANNPIAPSNRPATAAVDLGQRGLAGMPSSNNGAGPRASAVNLGSGQPSGSLSGTGSRGVVGVKLGVNGGTPGANGNGLGTRPQEVALGRQPVALPTQTATPAKMPVRTGPQVLYKPRPVYTAEATAAKVEGVVQVRIRVSSTGQVSVLQVVNGLGYGLDESAKRAVMGTRFRPAVDANGNPTDWEGVVNISFQMAA